MSNKHEFTSDLPEFMNYYDYATSTLTGDTLTTFIDGNGTVENDIAFTYLYEAWVKEYKITHTITDENNQVIHHIKYTELA